MRVWTQPEITQELLRLATHVAPAGVLVSLETRWSDIHRDRMTCWQHIGAWAQIFELPEGVFGAFCHCERVDDAVAMIAEALHAQGRLVS